MAQCLRSLKQYDESIEKFEEYLSTNPSDKAEVAKTVKLLKVVAADDKKRRDKEAAQEAAKEAERKRIEAESRAQVERENKIRQQERDKAQAALPGPAAAPPPPSLAPPPPPNRCCPAIRPTTSPSR